jgi:regulator of sigma E protease
MISGVPSNEPRISKIIAAGAAERAGLKPGDLVTAIDGQQVKTFADLKQSIWSRGGETLNLSLTRNGTPMSLRVTPDVKEESDGFGGKVKIAYIGVQGPSDAEAIKFERLGPIDALKRGAGETWMIVSVTMKYLGKLFTGTESAKQVGSVFTMAKGAGDAASTGPATFGFYIAFLSVSVGLINLFPIPMLDGGHLVFYTIESILGKPLGQRAQELGFRVGLSIVFMMMAFGLWNDLTRIFAKIVGS